MLLCGRSCAVVWGREDYIAQAEKKLGDKNFYKEANFKSKILQGVAETSNVIFKSLKKKEKII